MRRMRFSLSVGLVSVTAVALLLGVLVGIVKHHEQRSLREWEAYQKWDLDIADYKMENSLPGWAQSLLPKSTTSAFEHITELDLCFNDLSDHDARNVRDLHACEWVHTLKVANVTMTDEMFDAITTFPRLRQIYSSDRCEIDPSHPIDLRKVAVPGITITIE